MFSQTGTGSIVRKLFTGELDVERKSAKKLRIMNDLIRHSVAEFVATFFFVLLRCTVFFVHYSSSNSIQQLFLAIANNVFQTFIQGAIASHLMYGRPDVVLPVYI